MKIENIFLEFMELYYNKAGTRPISLRDVSIRSGVIARYTETGCTVYYLTTGNYIRIPWDIMDLFLSLNTYSGHRILHLVPESNVEKLIYLFVKFVNLFNNYGGEELEKVISDISEIGTNSFREWYKNKFNKSLEPVEFFGPDKNFEI